MFRLVFLESKPIRDRTRLEIGGSPARGSGFNSSTLRCGVRAKMDPKTIIEELLRDRAKCSVPECSNPVTRWASYTYAQGHGGGSKGFCDEHEFRAPEGGEEDEYIVTGYKDVAAAVAVREALKFLHSGEQVS